MRRKSTGPKEASSGFDPLNEIGAERLQTFAAICISWNYIETFLDASLGLSLRIEVPMFPHVSSRINGTDGKIAIIKESIARQASDDIATTISKTLNAVESHKKYRDGLIHVKIAHPAAIVSDTIQRRGVADEVLISQEALDALYERLSYIGAEMNQIFQMLHQAALGDFAEINADEDKKQQAVLQAGRALALLESYQSQRERLPPLPKFPDEPQEPLASEAAPAPRG